MLPLPPGGALHLLALAAIAALLGGLSAVERWCSPQFSAGRWATRAPG